MPDHQTSALVTLSLNQAQSFTPLEVTVGEIDEITGAVTVYRLVDQEQAQCFELSAHEMDTLIAVYQASKRARKRREQARQSTHMALAFALSNPPY